MPNARKLPSGNYRCRIFSHYIYQDGKKKPVYESFTAPSKREAEAAAAIWSMERKDRGQDITVADAVDRYITAKTAVLSPATIRGYRSIQKTALDGIGHIRLRQLDTEAMQIWISSLSATRGSKTTRNIYMLVVSAVSMFAPAASFHVSLPAKKKTQYTLPSDADMQKLLGHVKGKELWIALMLAYYYGLRRGEICALTSDDLDDDGMLTISKDVVLDEHGKWIVKDMPKTSDSFRTLKISEPLLSVLQEKTGKYITCHPNALIDRFRRAKKTCRISDFNFHSLRHCYASRAALLGVPDIYTAKLGGWKPGSTVLKEVYQNVLDAELQRQMEKMNAAIPDV